MASVEQWLTLYEAAKTLHHMALLTIANDLEEGTIPDIRYHKNIQVHSYLKVNGEPISQMNIIRRGRLVEYAFMI